jgi:hypothetical protein
MVGLSLWSNVHIGNTPELLQQIPGEEGDDGILGSDDLVRDVDMLFLDPALLVIVVSWQRFVDENGPRWAWLALLREELRDIELGDFDVPRVSSAGRHGGARVSRRVGGTLVASKREIRAERFVMLTAVAMFTGQSAG